MLERFPPKKSQWGLINVVLVGPCLRCGVSATVGWVGERTLTDEQVLHYAGMNGDGCGSCREKGESNA